MWGSDTTLDAFVHTVLPHALPGRQTRRSEPHTQPHLTQWCCTVVAGVALVVDKESLVLSRTWCLYELWYASKGGGGEENEGEGREREGRGASTVCSAEAAVERLCSRVS